MKRDSKPETLKAAYRKPECEIVELQSADNLLSGSTTGSGMEGWGEEDLDNV